MWIRSQNKKMLVKITSVNIYKNINSIGDNIFDINGDNESCVSSEDSYWKLGTYESEERALKVLDDIQEAIAACEVAKTTDTIKAVVNTLNEKQFANLAVGLFIYQMPAK